jgi:hypothetical protein
MHLARFTEVVPREYPVNVKRPRGLFAQANAPRLFAVMPRETLVERDRFRHHFTSAGGIVLLDTAANRHHKMPWRVGLRAVALAMVGALARPVRRCAAMTEITREVSSGEGLS